MTKLISSIALYALLATSGAAQATLIEQDLVLGSGDKLTTYDTDTGLNWLDINLTFGLSYNQVQSGYYINLGFRYANEMDISNLFQTLAEEPTGAFVGEMFKLGTPHAGGGGRYDLEGMFEDSTGSLSIGWLRYSLSTISTGMQNLQPFIPSGVDLRDYINPGTYGTQSWLVRNAVELPPPPIPEPETYTMLLAGLGLLGFTALRRKWVGRQTA